MSEQEGTGPSNWSPPLVRLDTAHFIPGRRSGQPILRSRRVKQVLVGATPGMSLRVDQAVERQSERLKVRVDEMVRADEPPRPVGRVLRRFRDNLHTLNHIARDPLLCYAEEGAVLSELRETLYLTESALRQFELVGWEPESDPVSDESMVAMADVIERQVDRLFDRMERLTTLRQALFRMSGVFEAVTCGGVPVVHDIEEIATAVIDAIVEDDPGVTLMNPDGPETPVRLAAHAVNVAQVVARLAETVPAWRDELTLAVCAALLQDLGMVQVPPEILLSTNLLTGPERTLVQRHPEMSASIVGQMRGHDERLVAAVYQHHERMDGSGYPEHRQGEAVDPIARLLAVADAFVGIQSPRAYRSPLSLEQAVVEISRAAAEGRLDLAWTCRLQDLETRWLKIPTLPGPRPSAPAVSALAA